MTVALSTPHSLLTVYLNEYELIAKPDKLSVPLVALKLLPTLTPVDESNCQVPFGVAPVIKFESCTVCVFAPEQTIKGLVATPALGN